MDPAGSYQTYYINPREDLIQKIKTAQEKTINAFKHKDTVNSQRYAQFVKHYKQLLEDLPEKAAEQIYNSLNLPSERHTVIDLHS